MPIPHLRPLITADDIARSVRRMAADVSHDYAFLSAPNVGAQHAAPLPHASLAVIGILKGAFIFMADLVRAVTVSQQLDFIRYASYGSGTRPQSEPQLLFTPSLSLRDRHVLLVEDIVDTGHTTSRALAWIKAQGAASVKLCALLDKPSRREVPVHIDYLGMTVPDLFIVGYGLDAAEDYRHLPYIAVLEER
jgi:hypoxanthine phosphoribosyltransferase